MAPEIDDHGTDRCKLRQDGLILFFALRDEDFQVPRWDLIEFYLRGAANIAKPDEFYVFSGNRN